MSSTILITGATGSVGRHVVTGLVEQGERVRALVRDPATAGLPEGVELVRGDLTDPSTLEEALTGVKRVFLLWPLVDAGAGASAVDAIAARAERVVHLSSAHMRHDRSAYEASLEPAIEGSGLAWTMLRPTGFATNTRMWADQIRAGDEVRWPFADARRTLIHERDIAAVAVRALTSDDLTGERPLLSGPELLSQAEQVEAIGEAIGRPLRLEEVDPEAIRPQLVEAFDDASFVDVSLAAWAAMVGQPEIRTSAVEEILGRPALTLDQWAREHAAEFRASGP